MNLEPVTRISMPGRRAPVALWLLGGALRKLIRNGTLCIHLPDGEVRMFGSGAPEITVAFRDWPTLRRIALDPGVAVGEAWMEGALMIEQGDLYDFLALCLTNYERAPAHWLWRAVYRARKAVRRFLMHNPVGRARRCVATSRATRSAAQRCFLSATTPRPSRAKSFMSTRASMLRGRFLVR